MKANALKLLSSMFLVAAVGIGGCKSQTKEDRGFFTSGSREADQRAEQRVAKDKQLNNDEVKAKEKKTLYERLGGQDGIDAIVNDFVSRVLADPRVNFERKGVQTGGFLKIGQTSAEWNANAGSIATLKQHMAQFLALSTGGPTIYEGKDMKAAHANMKITNAEFDASVGDLKMSLDKLNVPSDEQKELLAIIESTRPQIASER